MHVELCRQIKDSQRSLSVLFTIISHLFPVNCKLLHEQKKSLKSVLHVALFLHGS